MPEYIEERTKEKILESANSIIKGRLRSCETSIEELLAEKSARYSEAKKKVLDTRILRVLKKKATLNFILELINKERGTSVESGEI